MRPLPWELVEYFRFQPPGWESRYGDDYGAFLVEHRPTGAKLRVIASSGDKDIPWEHVSVSLPNRCPNWPEMAFIKDLFWLPTETVMQLHVPAKDHQNLHPYCLHLWRPSNQEIPRPPNDAVAVAGDINANRHYRDADQNANGTGKVPPSQNVSHPVS